MTSEEQEKYNKKTKRDTGLFKRALRIIKYNPDVILLMALIIFSTICGYIFARLYLGMTIAQVKVSITEFFEFCFFFICAISSFIGKLYVKPGVINKSLSGQLEDESKRYNVYGETIIPNDPKG